MVSLISSSHLILLPIFSLKIPNHVKCLMIEHYNMSFDTDLNRDIDVGYVGRKADICFFKYVHPTNQAIEINLSF